MTLKVNEIFSSIQGESTWSGLPCTFVRLTGCNLRCSYCDTQYAYDEGRNWSTQALGLRLEALQWRRICLTGGEPLLQQQTPAFVAHLLDNGYEVSLETNGSLDIRTLDQRCVKIMDLKCPSSGMLAHNRIDNLDHLGPHDQVKFVIAGPEDFQYACEMTDKIGRNVGADRILFSPAHGSLPAMQLAGWMLEGHTNARLQIQLHKQLWPEQDRGV
jgi:7-carboxy-7-deazaguanine synthase